MSDTPVLVRQLRLQAGRGVPAAGVRARVEDALRISSKPPALAHAFVLLRRLRLRMPAGASAQSVALQLEARWRAIEALAQPIDSAPDEAEVVWAADEVQARLALLQRWHDGGPATAWFWQRLLPEVSPAAPLAQRLQALLLMPLHSAEPALQAVEQARLWRLARPWLQPAGLGGLLWRGLTAAQAAALRAALDAPAHHLEFRPIRPAAARPGAGPSRAWPKPTTQPDPVPMAPAPRAAPAARAAAPPLPARTASAATPRRAAAHPAALPSPPAEALPTLVQAAAPAHGPAPTALASPGDAPMGPETTAWAGLWFVLPMLRRLRLDEGPDAACVLALLLQALARRHCFDGPAQRWVDALAERSGAADATAAQQAAAADALRRLRLQALQATRLPLRRVLHRPGRLLLAPHRVDVLLPLAQADIRLRRAGFDIDPGYLPWLDTVVHFHYL